MGKLFYLPNEVFVHRTLGDDEKYFATIAVAGSEVHNMHTNVNSGFGIRQETPCPALVSSGNGTRYSVIVRVNGVIRLYRIPDRYVPYLMDENGLELLKTDFSSDTHFESVVRMLQL